MKTAELPDGSELFFPDDYSDDKIDKAVIKQLSLLVASDTEKVNEMRLLRKSIEDGVAKITKVLSAPKILQRDYNDKPIGVKIKDM